VRTEPIDRLVQIGFSEYEAKAYLALLRASPVTGYQISKDSGVPRSMIYEVLGKLTARGAAITLRKEGGTLYAPVSAQEFFDQLHREHGELVDALKEDLSDLDTIEDREYVWNIEGHENIMAKAREMTGHARERIYLSLLPATFPALRPGLEEAIRRGVQVVMYTTEDLDLPGARVIAAPVPEQTSERVEGLWLILVVDGQEVLIGELLNENQARASWTGSPLFVFVAEHHLRTDLYLPHVLSLLEDQAPDFIREEDRDLFACAFERRLAC
jgi:sugar-specific transcriptional regulator TrmB